MLTVGSLFAGIGGFDLGFERAGFKTVWQVEIDPYCRKVLERHFPHAERFADIRDCGKHNLKPVDLLCGGFPCQDISGAGKRVGISGERSGLWSEMFRIICELRPPIVVVENVSDLLIRGMGRVLGDLASVGYDAEWDCLRAHDFGAPHLRERVFIVADTGCLSRKARLAQERGGSESAGREIQEIWGASRVFAELGTKTIRGIPAGFQCEPDLPRMANGIPDRSHRVTALGNALLPQIAEWIGNRILGVSE